MGGRSSSPQPQEQTVYSQKLPPYAEPYYTRLLQRGEAESLQPYTPYGGQRIAYFSPDELAAQSMTRGFAQAGTPAELDSASQRLQSMPTGITGGYAAGALPGGANRYRAGQLEGFYQAGGFDPGYDARVRQSQYRADTALPQYRKLGFEQGVSRFMSPYQQAVTDIEKREARRASDISGQQIESQAAQAGGLGGYREAILQAERERNLAQQMGDIQARGSQQAYQQAVQQLGAERAADLAGAQFGLSAYGAGQQAAQTQEQLAQSAFQAGEAARQQAAQLGLSAQQAEDAARQAQERFGQTAFQTQEQARQTQAQQALARYQAREAARQQAEKFGQSAYDLSQRYGLATAQQLAGLGQARQQDVLSRIQALSGIGSQARALRQAGLDIGYEDFMRQRAYPQQQLGFFSNLLQGLPIQPQQTVSTFQQQPGLFQQALGLGLGGLGLYKGLQR